MEYLVTAEEMKQYDSNTINQIGIPGMVLMERAALEAFRVIKARLWKPGAFGKRVFVLAGTGNNGGDGLALARLLAEDGWQVDIACLGQTLEDGHVEHYSTEFLNGEAMREDKFKASEQWKQQMQILSYYPVSFCEKNEDTEYTIMIDALFGVGLSRKVEGEYACAIEHFNKGDGTKISLDIPSGIDSNTGEVLGCAIKADMTVTFGFVKRGLVLYPGAEYAGEVIKAEIGISERSFMGKLPEMFCYNEEPEALLPSRDAAGNKGTFGKVLLVAGSSKMAGAAVLAAKASYRIGAGMVKVISSPDNRIIIQQAVPEALYGTYEDMDESLKWADVIVIGPGIGVREQARVLLEKALQACEMPLLVDADGLNLLSADGNLLQILTDQCKNGRRVVLTPHVGELSRLTKRTITELKEDLAVYGKGFAEEIQGVVVAKDARTFICRPNGNICVNLRGNSGMATAGSGDVLSGIIGGLMAQRMEPFAAASVGVYIHAHAGDRVASEIGEHACMAGDLVK